MESTNSDEKRAYEEVKAGPPNAINKMKKTVSLGQNLNNESPRVGGGQGGNDSDSGKSSGGSGMFRIN